MIHAMKAVATWLVALSILVGFSPVARADNTADYLASLDKMQIPYSSATNVVNIANTLCQQLRNNIDPGSAIVTVANAGYTGSQAGQIAFAATRTFCPDMAPVIDKWANSP